jgi:hypothetical protein
MEASMSIFGTVEILIVAFIGLVYLAVPVALLVLVYLTYDKVRRIEQKLAAQSDRANYPRD